jgi:hypothetical protein
VGIFKLPNASGTNELFNVSEIPNNSFSPLEGIAVFFCIF